MQEKGQKRVKEACGGCWPQTQMGPSTMLKRGPKYFTLQLMARPKTVCKNAQNAMQNKAKKRDITQSIKRMPQTVKYP